MESVCLTVGSLFVALMYKKLERFWISIFTRIRAREKRVFCLFRLISNLWVEKNNYWYFIRLERYKDIVSLSTVSWSLLCRRSWKDFNVDFCTCACMRKPIFGSFLINEPRNLILFFINSSGPGRMFCFRKYLCSSYAEEVRDVLEVDFYTTRSKIHETDQNKKSTKVCKSSSFNFFLGLTYCL